MIGFATLISHSTIAREKIGGGSGNGEGSGIVKPTNGEKGAQCAPTSKVAFLAFNDVNALLETGGTMFQNRLKGTPAYEVPRTEKGDGPKAIFAGSLWMGGKDLSGQLKVAAVRFRQVGNDFWAGPLTVTLPAYPDVNYDPTQPVTDLTIRGYGDANISDVECAAWDKFFPMSKSTVIKFSVWWEACTGPSATQVACDDIPADSRPTNDELSAINLWPAHGEPLKNQDYYLAPFYDRNGNGVYDPSDGEYPWYDDILGRDDIQCGVDRRVSLFGDNTIWWVFNDKGNIHSESKGDPIGLEIRAQAFAFGTSDEINRMSFYNYEIINRSSQTLTNTYFSQWIDADLGGPNDDYVGCDVSRGLGYAYNGDLSDLTDGGSVGYGNNPPAIGVDFFEGPYQDPDGRDNVGPVLDSLTGLYVGPTVIQALADTGIVYKGIGVGYGDGIIDNERFGMRRFTYFTNAASFPYTDPSVANQYYNFMEGTWADGSEMYYGGNGGNTATTAIPSDYMFPGDSDPLFWSTGGVDPGFDWTEVQAGTQAGDRRFVQSAGPFTLKPGAMNNITVGIVYGRSYDGDLFASVEAMKRADTKAQALFDACFRIIEPPAAPRLIIQELENELVLLLDNPSTSNNYKEDYRQIDDINIPPTFVDRYYNFEGYQIFQMIDGTASVADIEDNTKARLVAQCDIENGISKLINFEFDEALGFSKPVLKVAGENKGIRHSFLVKEDLFASGVRKLVNHKTYYYVAVAYAYNQFKKYDPNDGNQLDGQKKLYISSRLSYDLTSIKSVAGVPHNPMPEADGTFSYINFGSTPQITRLDGTGNGNRSLDLTAASTAQILSTGRMNSPTYDYGKGPINVKVIDPLNVQGGYYELKMRNYTPSSFTNSADTAKWTAYRYQSEGGALIDSILSERTIAKNNEQLVPEWGVSITITQKKYIQPNTGAGASNTYITNPISATLSYSDSSKQWLGFIEDNDVYYPTNWIRSGTFVPNATNLNPNLPNWQQEAGYPDELGQDDTKDYVRLLGGGVAPHRLVGYQSDYMPLAYHPAAASQVSLSRKNASISYVPSVDIVMTSDKSKWTRCPVIELGREPGFTVGGAIHGEMRKSPSVNKEGANDGSGTMGMGWFPGYAIDLETGTRMSMAFGENSFLAADGGSDMIWNPSSRLQIGGTPIFGGLQPIWVFAADIKDVNAYTTLVNMPAYDPINTGSNFLEQQFNIMSSATSTSGQKSAAAKVVYSNLMWVVNPILKPGKRLLSSDATIKLRVNKEYHNYSATGKNNGKPMYSWNMDDIATSIRNPNALAEALAMINVVPNPYYAFSEYEKTRLETTVKITNLPEKCTVKIYTTNGKLVRLFKKDSPVTSLDWDLNNTQRIPVSSGVYLIHVEVPEIGERVLKLFLGVRQTDLQGI